MEIVKGYITITDISDGEQYSIELSQENVVIPSNSTYGQLANCTATFWKKTGNGVKTAASMYCWVYARKGVSLTLISSASNLSQANSSHTFSVNSDYLTTSYDAIVVYIYPTQGGFNPSSQYYAKKEIAITKNGDKGNKGDDGVAYTLTCSPAAVNFRRNAAGEFATAYINVSCEVKKSVGGTISDVTPGSGSGVYLFYRKLTTGSAQAWTQRTSASTSQSVSYAEASAATYAVTGLEYALTSNSSTPNNANVLARTTVPVMLDGMNGDPGSTGKAFYSAGQWNDQTKYTANEYECPLVWIDAGSGGREWYYLPEGESTNQNPKQTGTPGNPWKRAQNNWNVILTEALFADFASFQSAVITGDWLISKHGFCEGGVVDDERATYLDGGVAKPYYLKFDPTDPKGETTTNFKPNFALDLKTGALYGSKIDISGTIHAENFFHNVCFFNGSSYSRPYYRYLGEQTQDYYSKFVKDQYYTREQVYSLSGGQLDNDDPTGFEKSTGNADIIVTFIFRDNNSIRLSMPSPDDFPGKMVQLFSYTYGNVSTDHYYVDGHCMSNAATSLTNNGTVGVDSPSSESQVHIGGSATYISTKLTQKTNGHEYVWLLLENKTGGDIIINGDPSMSIAVTSVVGLTGNVTTQQIVDAIETAGYELTDTTYRLTLNGTQKGTPGGADLGSFYAPTAIGSDGQFLKSTGSGAPSWSALPTATTSAAGIVQLGTGAAQAAKGDHSHSQYALASALNAYQPLISDLASYVKVRSLSDGDGNNAPFNDILKNQTGSFLFTGGNLIDGHYDWVGIQVSSGNDLGQLVWSDGTLMVRQNDTARTASAFANGWSAWATVLTNRNFASYLNSQYLLANGMHTENNGISDFSVNFPQNDNHDSNMDVDFQGGASYNFDADVFVNNKEVATKSWVSQNYALKSELHTHSNKAVLDSITEAMVTKLNGIEAGANKYTHPTNGANTTIAAADGRVLSAITVNNLGHVTSVSYKALSNSDIPSTLTLNALTVSGAIGGSSADFDSLTKGGVNVATVNDLSAYLPLSGGTMTGLLTMKANQYADDYTGALNMSNSNIYGVNGIYTADLADSPAEGISFYRDATHVDTLWMKNGVMYFTPNRQLGTNGTSYTVWHSGNSNLKFVNSKGNNVEVSWNEVKSLSLPFTITGSGYMTLDLSGISANVPAATTSVAGIVKLGTTEGTAAQGNHTHSELHTHSNKSVLDGITADSINHWNAAYGYSSSIQDIEGWAVSGIAVGTGTYANQIVWYKGNDPTADGYVNYITIPYATAAGKLSTSRTLWGQSFDGSGNVNGKLSIDLATLGNTVLGQQYHLIEARYKNAAGINFGYAGILSLVGSGETDVAYNMGVRIGSQSGMTWISAGESAQTLSGVLTDMCNKEDVYVTADGGIHFITGIPNTSKDSNGNPSYVLAVDILSNGKVGIGTASPAYKLDVNGSARVSGDLYVGSTKVSIEGHTHSNYQNKLSFVDTKNNNGTVDGNAIGAIAFPFTKSVDGKLTLDLSGITEQYKGTVTGISVNGGSPASPDANGVVSLGTLLSSLSVATGTNNGTIKYAVNGGNYTEVAVKGLQALAYKGSLAFTDLSSHPTTLSGYGITDAAAASQLANYVTTNTEQDVSGTKKFYSIRLGQNRPWKIYGEQETAGSVATEMLKLAPENGGKYFYFTDHSNVNVMKFFGGDSSTNPTKNGYIEFPLGIIISVASGTAPMTINSTTKVNNFNADMLDGVHADGLFTALTNTNDGNLSLTIGGTTKTLAIVKATNAYEAEILGSSTVGSTTKGIYLSNGSPAEMTYSLGSTVDAGTLNRIAYYKGPNEIAANGYIAYIPHTETAAESGTLTNGKKYIDGLRLWGTTVGNLHTVNGSSKPSTISGKTGDITFGDGGPQIQFSTGANTAQDGAIIFTNHDSAGAGASFHFVSNQADWNVHSKRFVARDSVTIGYQAVANGAYLPNTNYALFVGGSALITGNTYIGSVSNDNLAATQGWVTGKGYQTNAIEKIVLSGSTDANKQELTGKAVTLPLASTNKSGVVMIGDGLKDSENHLTVDTAWLTNQGFTKGSYLPLTGGTTTGALQVHHLFEVYNGNSSTKQSAYMRFTRNGVNGNDYAALGWNGSNVRLCILGGNGNYTSERDALLIGYDGQLKLQASNGTAPITTSSTTLVTNLNADLLDGRNGAEYAMIGSLATNIANNTDLNNIVSAGTYTCQSSGIATTLGNTPYTGGNFRLWHIINTGTDGNANSQWSAQMLLAPNAARLFLRSHSQNAFGSWREFAFKDSTVTSVKVGNTSHNPSNGQIDLSDEYDRLDNKFDSYLPLSGGKTITGSVTMNSVLNFGSDLNAGIQKSSNDLVIGNSNGNVLINASGLLFNNKQVATINDITNINTSGAISIDRSDADVTAKGTQYSLIKARMKNSGTGTYSYNDVISLVGAGETGTTVNNLGVRLGSQSGMTWISAGENGTAFSSAVSDICNTENMYLTADGGIYFYTGVQNNGTGGKRTLLLNSDGSIDAVGNIKITKNDGNFRVSSPSANEEYMFGASSSGYIYGSTNGRYMSFLNGNVGIGTTNPANKLDVSGSARVTGNLSVGGIQATQGISVGGTSVSLEGHTHSEYLPKTGGSLTGNLYIGSEANVNRVVKYSEISNHLTYYDTIKYADELTKERIENYSNYDTSVTHYRMIGQVTMRSTLGAQRGWMTLQMGSRHNGAQIVNMVYGCEKAAADYSVLNAFCEIEQHGTLDNGTADDTLYCYVKADTTNNLTFTFFWRYRDNSPVDIRVIAASSDNSFEPSATSSATNNVKESDLTTPTFASNFGTLKAKGQRRIGVLTSYLKSTKSGLGTNGYWGKIWDIALPKSTTAMRKEMVFMASAPDTGYSGVCILRLKHSYNTTSNKYTFPSVVLEQVYGNVPMAQFRVYYSLLNGKVELWCNLTAYTKYFNFTVLKQTADGAGDDAAVLGFWYPTDIQTAQTLPTVVTNSLAMVEMTRKSVDVAASSLTIAGSIKAQFSAGTLSFSRVNPNDAAPVYSFDGQVTTGSDSRRKTIDKYLEPSVYDIAFAPLVAFRWKNGDSRQNVGTIAQYWEKVLPQAVHENSDGFLSLEYSTIALAAGVTASRKAVDNERRIIDLERELTALRARVAELEQQEIEN